MNNSSFSFLYFLVDDCFFSLSTLLLLYLLSLVIHYSLSSHFSSLSSVFSSSIVSCSNPFFLLFLLSLVIIYSLSSLLSPTTSVSSSAILSCSNPFFFSLPTFWVLGYIFSSLSSSFAYCGNRSP